MEVKLNCVLLIDDDEITNFLQKTVLVRTGIAGSIHITESVREGIDLIKEFEGCENPELIFLDLNMPGLTGWDFIEEYKMVKEAFGKKCVIVILTASANPDDAKKASTLAEIAEYRTKPLTDVMVNEIIQKHFARSSGTTY